MAFCMSTYFVTFHSVLHLLWQRKDRAELLMSVLLCTTTVSGHEFSLPFLFSLLFDSSCDCFGFSSAIFLFMVWVKWVYSRGLWARLLTYKSVFIFLLHDIIMSFLSQFFIVKRLLNTNVIHLPTMVCIVALFTIRSGDHVISPGVLN